VKAGHTIRRGGATAALAHGLVGAAALVWMAPVLIMIVASLKPDAHVLAEAGTLRGLIPTEAYLQNYRDVFERVAFGRIFRNTLLINGAIVLGGLVVNSTAAYALARLRWPGRRLALALVLALLVVPFEAVALPLFYGTSVLGWRDSYSVQIAPFLANALSIYLFYTFFLGFPREVEEAARVDGAGPWRTFLSVVVPQSRPVFATVAIATFIIHWGLYLWPLLVTTTVDVRPLPLGIATFRTLPPLQWGDIMAFAVLMVAPVAVAFFFMQRWFVKSVATAGMKG
jgi:multiple sugar transport system permease protein